MRILLWHGWLLEGSGSNVYTARVTRIFREQGHDVLLVCQEGHSDRYEWIDAVGTVGVDGVSELDPTGASPAAGRCVVLRPRIGTLLPVFVLDDYEGFEVKRFVDLSDGELAAYLDANVEALRAAAAWHGTEVAIAGHAVPGGVIARRALGPDRYVTKIHGSDVEYAMRPDARYRDLAREGLPAGRAVTGSGGDVLRRCLDLVPGIEALLRVVPPGVDEAVFHPRPRAPALTEVAERLRGDPDATRGRPGRLDGEVRAALAARDGRALDELAFRYDQEVPDPDAAERLAALAAFEGPVVGSFGKLIPQKGVHHLLAAVHGSPHRPHTLVVGFGTNREWLHSLAAALERADGSALEWLAGALGLPGLTAAAGEPAGVTFTGRLDHRYAPSVLAAMDVLVVPSILDEAFGMVAVEGAAAGALPLVARHSGLAEIAGALEEDTGRVGLFAFEPGPAAVANLRAGLDHLLGLPGADRDELRAAVSAAAQTRWSWTSTAAGLLRAATGTDGALSGPKA
ncbi:MAG TPA: glycosyltransferase [Actinomycetota bacterium]